MAILALYYMFVWWAISPNGDDHISNQVMNK